MQAKVRIFGCVNAPWLNEYIYLKTSFKEPIPAMQPPILPKKSAKKSSLSPQEALFNRQRHKVDRLRRQIEVLKQECDQALALYHSDIKPRERQAAQLIEQFILRVQELTLKPKTLNKKERAICQEIFKVCLKLLRELLPQEPLAPTLQDLYQQLYGKTIAENFLEELADFQDYVQERMGGPIDLSHIDPNDTPQQAFEKFLHTLHDTYLHEPQRDTPKAKSKKQLQKEQKALELQALQSKGLNSIYKRLVKALHPDLEQDPQKRAEKDQLMKALTVAYDRQDLLALLKIESAWLGEVSQTAPSLSVESLEAYNALLKEQIEALQQELLCICVHPRYMDIHRYIEPSPEKPLSAMAAAMVDCEELINEYRHRLQDLSGSHPLKTLKQALAGLEKADFPQFSG